MLSAQRSSFILSILICLSVPGWSQLTLTPRVNYPLPIGPTLDYGTPRVGYGIEAGYRVFQRWKMTLAYDRYRFELNTGLENLDVSPTLIALLNLPKTIVLDFTADSWNGGIRYQVAVSRLSYYFGVEASTNQVAAQGYGLSVSRPYWGIAPVVGAEWSFNPRWSGRMDTRMQTMFIREEIPFIRVVTDRYLIFIPIQVGIVAKFAVKRSR